MGRAKLEMKYRKDARARMITYKTRIKGIEKKAKELAVLCGVDVLVTSYFPDENGLCCYPTNPAEFQRILQRYNKSSVRNCVLPSPPLNSSSRSQEELISINNKIDEVRLRIRFLEAEKQNGQPSTSSSEDQPSTSSEDQPSNVMEDGGKIVSFSFSDAAVSEDDGDMFSLLEDLGDNVFLNNNYDNYFNSIPTTSWNLDHDFYS